MDLLQSYLDRIRYRALRPSFERAYQKFELLLAELLIKNLAARVAVENVCAELARPQHQACAQRWVVEFEFDSLVSSVIAPGDALSEPIRIWPYGTDNPRVLEALIVAVRSAALEELDGLALTRRSEIVTVASLGLPTDLACCASWDGPGRRPSPLLASVSRCIVRERLFADGRSMADGVRHACIAWPNDLRKSYLEKRVKQMRRCDVPIPKWWHQTLVGTALQVLKQRDALCSALPISAFRTRQAMRVFRRAATNS